MEIERHERHQTIARIARVVGQLIWLGRKRSAQNLSAFGLTAPQYFALLELSYLEEESPMNVLAEITHQDAATMTGIVDRLVRLGYVARRRGEDDRRKVYVSLAEPGRRVIEKIRQASHANWRKSFCALSQQELEEMLRMLEAVLNAWETDSQMTGDREEIPTSDQHRG
jgi:DNA-binding MarR family transcriptional regulator